MTLSQIYNLDSGFDAREKINTSFEVVDILWGLTNSSTSLDLNQVLTNGNITGGKNIIVTNGDVIKSTDNKAGLSISTGGSVEISSSNFDGTESFISVDSTSASLYSQGSQGFSTDESRAWVLHSAEVRLDAPIVRIADNLITSGTANKSQIDFSVTGDRFHVTTDGGLDAEAYIELRSISSIIGYSNEYLEFDSTSVKLKSTTLINLDSPIYRFTQLTASTVPYLDASKNLVSSTITPTQLSYLDATSSIQTQLDNRITLLAKNNVQSSHTGTLTETLILSFDLTDLFAANDIIKTNFRVYPNNSANTKTIRIKVNTSATLTGAQTLGTYAFTSSAANFQKSLWFENTLASIKTLYPTTTVSNDETSLNNILGLSTITHDFTGPTYFLISAQLTVTSDTLYFLNGEILRKR